MLNPQFSSKTLAVLEVSRTRNHGLVWLFLSVGLCLLIQAATAVIAVAVPNGPCNQTPGTQTSDCDDMGAAGISSPTWAEEGANGSKYHRALSSVHRCLFLKSTKKKTFKWPNPDCDCGMEECCYCILFWWVSQMGSGDPSPYLCGGAPGTINMILCGNNCFSVIGCGGHPDNVTKYGSDHMDNGVDSLIKGGSKQWRDDIAAWAADENGPHDICTDPAAMQHCF